MPVNGKPRVSAPRGLGPEGRKLWRRITDGLTMRPDELAILESACKVSDSIARLEKLRDGEPGLVKGSKGQSVLHPVEAELRLQHGLRTQLLVRLDIPEERNGTASEWDGLSATQRARKAALLRHRRVA